MLNMATLGKVPSLGCGSYDLIAQVSVFASTNNICAWVSFPCLYNFIRRSPKGTSEKQSSYQTHFIAHESMKYESPIGQEQAKFHQEH